MKFLKIIFALALVFIFMFWISLQLAFGMVSKTNHSGLDINTIVAFEWIILLVFLLLLIFVGATQKLVWMFSFIIANLCYMLVICAMKPIYMKNMGWHHVDYTPVYSPLMANIICYIVLLIYMNVAFREKDITSLRFSWFTYGFSLLAILTIVTVRISSETAIYNISHFRG